ncbi:MAG: hypothetical protein MK289_07740 [Trichodesmium sp. ALOHA_ZT_67]|nr:hypothetical protein [Trichodesmium erythraeum GBRTRLIN201]MCH2048359.1 hypothetical protein [Trichodesmium sp. ALOHA_ZT_67]
MVKVISINHVAIVLDLDRDGGVFGMNDVSQIPNITKYKIINGTGIY